MLMLFGNKHKDVWLKFVDGCFHKTCFPLTKFMRTPLDPGKQYKYVTSNIINTTERPLLQRKTEQAIVTTRRIKDTHQIFAGMRFLAICWRYLMKASTLRRILRPELLTFLQMSCIHRHTIQRIA